MHKREAAAARFALLTAHRYRYEYCPPALLVFNRTATALILLGCVRLPISVGQSAVYAVVKDNQCRRSGQCRPGSDWCVGGNQKVTFEPEYARAAPRSGIYQV